MYAGRHPGRGSLCRRDSALSETDATRCAPRPTPFGGCDLKLDSAFVHTTLMGDQTKGDRRSVGLNVPGDAQVLRADVERG